MSGARIPPAVRETMGDEGTFGLIELLDAERKYWRDDVLTTAGERFERRLAQESSVLQQDFQRTLQDGLAAIRGDLADTRVELLKWSFVFWIGQVAALAALLAFMLRATGR